MFSIDQIQIANVGIRIREARKKRGISQAMLADMLDISISHLSSIETGRSNFGVDILMRITEALQVSADWLLSTSIPTVIGQHSQEMQELFEGCTSDEIAAIIRMATNMKKDLHDAKQIAISRQ